MFRLLALALAGSSLASKHRSNVTKHSSSFQVTDPTCQCLANDPSWKKTTRTEAKCIFIDLGAADGNTFATFTENGYGKVHNCPTGGKWEAFLVEANPQFTSQLNALQENFPGQVHSYAEHAAFSCEGTTSFNIDMDKTHNQWGSSLMDDAPDAKKSGNVKVTVPMINVAKLIAENVRPDDWVMLKVDIEGAEYDVIPCLAQFKDAGLIDRVYLEEHHWFSSVTPAKKQAMTNAKQQLVAMNVDFPTYYSSS